MAIERAVTPDPALAERERRERRHYRRRVRLLSLLAFTAMLPLIMVSFNHYADSGRVNVLSSEFNAREYRKDSTLRGLKGRQYGEDGRIDLNWTATTATRESNEADTLLTAPRYRAKGDKDEIWMVTAKSGVLSANNQRIELVGEVIVEEKNGGTQLLTPEMRIELKPRFISSTKPVRIVSPRGVTTAVGFQGDLPANHLILMNEVTSEFLTP